MWPHSVCRSGVGARHSGSCGRYWPVVGPHPKAQLGKDPSLRWRGCWQHPVPYWVLDWGPHFLAGYQPVATLSSWPHVPPQHGCLLPQSQQERNKTDTAIFRNLTVERHPITFAILYWLSWSRVLPTHGEGITQGQEQWQTGSWELPERQCAPRHQAGGWEQTCQVQLLTGDTIGAGFCRRLRSQKLLGCPRA